MLQTEAKVHEEIKKKIEELGWENGHEILKFKENDLIPEFYFSEILEKKVLEINDFLESLEEYEKREILDDLKTELENATEERFLTFLRHGVPLKIGDEIKSVKLIGGDDLFFFLHEAKFKGSPENIKPDFTLFINGLPVVIIEAKSEAIPYSHTEALKQIRRYEMFSPELFNFVQFAVAYGDEKLYTATMPNWRREEKDIPAFRWRVNKQNNIFDLLKPERIVEFLKYFIFYLYDKDKGIKSKLIARYNQYSATKKAMKRIEDHLNGGKSKGLIWHWQGSGKTYTMFFIANCFIDKFWHTHPIVFFVVDREDLETQHDKFFKAVQEENFKNNFEKVERIEDLLEIFERAKRSEIDNKVIERGIYLTTIQKFQKGGDEEKSIYKLLLKFGEEEAKLKGLRLENDKKEELLRLGGVKKRNVLFLIDEAHRTQYGILGAMRKACFPNSIAFGFTGTPIFKHEKNTFEEFSYPKEGELYLDVYFIADAVRDGFTLPISYHVLKEGEIKAEGIQIKLKEDEIKGFIEEYMEKKGRIEDLLEGNISKAEVSRYINKARVILLNERRIEKVAEYIANRIQEDTNNFKFKAMVVAVNRIGCVRYKKALEKHLVAKFGEEAKEWVEVVMTYNHNDTEKEIIEYREELMNKRKEKDMNEINKVIREEFLAKENPRILVVTDMLITGFDAPKLKVMYLDKPLYEHRLLQAIARVNRPYEGKEFGLVIDSVGLIEHLAKTMAFYNLLAQEEIAEDLKENIAIPIDTKFEEFKSKFKDVCEKLRSLEFSGLKLGIELEDVKKALKSGLKESIEAKLSTIAMLNIEKEDTAKIVKLVNDIRAILKLYKALGAYEKKLLYVEDIEALAWLYYKIKRIIAGKRTKLGKEFWNELLEFIHNKTIVEDLKEVDKVVLRDVDELLNELKEEWGIITGEVADLFFEIRASLMERLHDPVYKEIFERIEKLRIEWIDKAINNKILLSRLKELLQKKNEYDKKVEGKSEVERILETLRQFTFAKCNCNVDFGNTLNTVKKIMGSKLKELKPSDRNEIRKALLKDLFKVLDEKTAKEIMEELSEFLEKEIERLWIREKS
ncbi:MAG: HsdR family type I site-specific deoxyribonuclease [Archaeoglobaceae archaeon]